MIQIHPTDKAANRLSCAQVLGNQTQNSTPTLQNLGHLVAKVTEA